MKKGVIFGGIGGLAALGAAAFVMASAGTPAPNHDAMEKLRGTDAYYAESESKVATDVGGELVAGLNGGSFVKLKFDVEYRVGKESLKHPDKLAAAFTEKSSKVRSMLILMLGSKTTEALRMPNLLVFKEELVRMLNDALFPEKLARIEDVYFKELVVEQK
jgi:flagellar basal body-associated protein FliL